MTQAGGVLSRLVRSADQRPSRCHRARLQAGRHAGRAVGQSPKKPLFSHADRLALLKQALEPIGKRTDTEFKIVDFDGLMVNAARANGAKLIIRGLRDTTDYNFEMQMVGMNAQMAPDLQTVFLPSSPARPPHLGHAGARRSPQLGGDISAFVPANRPQGFEVKA